MLGARPVTLSLLGTILVFSLASKVLASPPGDAAGSDRAKLEKEFGKYFATQKNFEIYGVTLRQRGKADQTPAQGDDDASRISGTIVSPPGVSYTARKFDAEVSTKKHVTVQCSTSDSSFSFHLGSGKSNDNNHSKATGRQVTKFDWCVPADTDISTLRITKSDCK